MCTATADDRYISFVMMQPTKFWADVCRHIDLDDLIDDPRFATAESIAENTADGRRDPARGHRHPDAARVERTFRHPGRAVGAGAGHPAGGRRRADPGQRIHRPRRANSNWSPTRCSSTSAAPQTGPAPGFAEQTDEILLELGLDWDRIIELKTAGAVT